MNLAARVARRFMLASSGMPRDLDDLLARIRNDIRDESNVRRQVLREIKDAIRKADYPPEVIAKYRQSFDELKKEIRQLEKGIDSGTQRRFDEVLAQPPFDEDVEMFDPDAGDDYYVRRLNFSLYPAQKLVTELWDRAMELAHLRGETLNTYMLRVAPIAEHSLVKALEALADIVQDFKKDQPPEQAERMRDRSDRDALIARLVKLEQAAKKIRDQWVGEFSRSLQYQLSKGRALSPKQMAKADEILRRYRL